MPDASPPLRSHPLFRALKGAAKLGLGLGLLAFLAWRYRDDLAALGERSVRWDLFALSAAVMVVALLATFFRWYLLVRAQELPFTYRRAVGLGLVGYVFNFVIPSAVGGDLVKVVLLVRDQERRTVAVTTVAVDRLAGLLGMVWFAGLAAAAMLVGGGADGRLLEIARFTCLLAIGVSLGAVVPFVPIVQRSGLVARAGRLPVVGSVVAEIFGALGAYRARWRVLVIAAAMSLVSHLGFISSIVLSGRAVWADPPDSGVLFLITPLGLMFGAIPLTPGGLGVAEVALERLFEFAGFSGAQAVLMMLVSRSIQIGIALLGWLGSLALFREASRVARQGSATNEPSGPVA